MTFFLTVTLAGVCMTLPNPNGPGEVPIGAVGLRQTEAASSGVLPAVLGNTATLAVRASGGESPASAGSPASGVRQADRQAVHPAGPAVPWDRMPVSGVTRRPVK
jgi:hypothetical protein